MSRSAAEVSRKAAALVAVSGAACYAVAVYWVERVIVAYDMLTFRVIPLARSPRLSGRPFMLVLVALPACLALAASRCTGVLGISLAAGLGLLAAELYSAGIHAQAYRRYFDRGSIPKRSRLWGHPRDPRDRRLQSLFSLALALCVGILCALGVATATHSAAAVVAVLPLAAKYYEHCSWDFEVILHWDMHLRVLDTQRGGPLARLLADWVLGPSLGYVPLLYRSGHGAIHHRENVGPDDPHSPLPYNRASFIEFSVFLVKMTSYSVTGFEVIRHRRSSRWVRVKVVGIGIGATLAIGLMWLLGCWPLLVYLMVVHAIRGYIAARSIYTWHALVDQAHLRHPCFSALSWVPRRILGDTSAGPGEQIAAFYSGEGATSVPYPFTGWAFFDNFHALHHLHPKAHYEDYPALLVRRMPVLARSGLMIMDIDAVTDFARRCWKGDLEWISGAVISPDSAKSRSELERLLGPYDAVRSSFAVAFASRAGARVESWVRRLI